MAFVHGVQPIGAACHTLQLRSRLRFSRRSPRLAAPCAVRGRGRVPRSSRKAPEPALRAEPCMRAMCKTARHASAVLLLGATNVEMTDGRNEIHKELAVPVLAIF